MNSQSASTKSPVRSAAATRRPGRPAARRPRSTEPRRRFLLQTSLGLVEAIHGPDLTWPDGETTVELICAAVCAAG